MYSKSSFVIALAFLVALLAVGCQAGTRCPDRIAILPCSCRYNWPYTEVTCYSTQDKSSMLKKAFKAMSDRQMVIDRLTILGSLPEVPADFMKETTIHYLIFRVNDLSNISEDAFKGMHTIHGIWFYETNLTSVPMRALSRSKLTELIINNNNIASIPRQLFGSMVYGPALRTLHLVSNNIRTIGDSAFYNLVGLEELSLKGNLLKALPSTILPVKASHMIDFILQKNTLSSVPIDVIKRLPSDANVDLSINKIITGDFYAILAVRRSINLIANDLVCNCSLKIVAIFNEDNPGKLKVTGRCSEPTLLAGKFLKELRTLDFKNC